MATRKTKRYDEGGITASDDQQDGAANLAKMMGRTPTPQAQDFPPERIIRPMDRPMPMDFPPERIIGEPGPTQEMDFPPERIIPEFGPTQEDVAPKRSRPMPMPIRGGQMGSMRSAPGAEQSEKMVDAVKNIMARQGRQPIRARAMGAGMGGYAKGGSVSKASSRADGIAQRGKTRGKMC